MVDEEYTCANEVDVDGFICGSYFRHTQTAVPCAHEMMEMEEKNTSIQLIDIHPFWRTLEIKSATTHNKLDEESHFHPACRYVIHLYFKDIQDLPKQSKNK